jgi:hypothetical protein
MTRSVLTLLTLLLSACGADLGLLGGLEARTAHFVQTGRIAVSTRLGDPLNEEGVLLGAELESRSEANVGSRWEAGAMAGWGSGPAALGGRLGIEAYAQLGTPLHATLFDRGDLYGGATIALPLFLGSARHVEDLNRSTMVMSRRFELVPMLRTRFHRGHNDTAHTCHVDVTLGLALRLRMVSDLF